MRYTSRAAGAMVALAAGQAAAQPMYDSVIRLGLFEGENVRASDGRAVSSLSGGDGPSFLFGISEMYASDPFAGRDSWVYDGQCVHRIGLTGSQYQQSTGRRSSTASRGRDGIVIGISDRFDANDVRVGVDAWVYRNGATEQVGLTGSEFVRTDGRSFASATRIGNNGWVAGTSDRYSGNSFRGRAAWYNDGVETRRLGFTSGDHTSTDGRQESGIVGINALGQISGTSGRYAPGSTSTNGQTAWIWENGSYTTVGLSGAKYTSSDGLQNHAISAISDAGIASGISRTYGTDGRFGGDAWIYDGATIRQVGLQGAEYVSEFGVSSAGVRAFDDLGRSLGTSNSFINGTSGSAAWYDDGTQTRRIGLFGAGYLRDNGSQINRLNFHNASLQAAGTSIAYAGSEVTGEDAWIWNGTETLQIGLAGVAYERADGDIYNRVSNLNEAGDVAGTTTRYNQSNTTFGQDAWYYDASAGETYALIGDVSSEGRAVSFVSHLTDEGFALGGYDKYAQDGVTATRHAFVFRPEIGFIDLGALISGSLSDRGIEVLSDARFGDAIEYLIAYGLEQGQDGQSVYLITPTPGGFGLLAAGGLLAARRRRR